MLAGLAAVQQGSAVGCRGRAGGGADTGRLGMEGNSDYSRK